MKTSAEKTGRHHRRTSCRHVRSILVEYLEGQLPADEQDRVSAHLQRCSHCAAERTALKKTLQVLSRRELPEPDERFWMEMKLRVREALREERMPRRQPSPARHEPGLRRSRWRQRSSSCFSGGLTFPCLPRPVRTGCCPGWNWRAVKV